LGRERVSEGGGWTVKIQGGLSGKKVGGEGDNCDPAGRRGGF